MFQLVPCPSCARHVRLTDRACPFCDGTLDVAALSERHATRRVSTPAGLKRAALFALTTTAAACGGRTQADDDTAASLVTFDDSQAAAGSSGFTATSSATSVNPIPTTPTMNSTMTAPPVAPGPTDPGEPATTIVPVYGAPVVTTTPEPTSEATSETTDWGQPVYGAPIPTELSTELPVVSSAGVTEESTHPPADTTGSEGSSVASETLVEMTSTTSLSTPDDAGVADTSTADASLD